MTGWELVGVVMMRITVAAALGACVGLERGLRLRDAGIRTHSIVAAAAAAYMLLSVYAYADSPFETDYSILATQIVYGFSFMGAGMILRSKYQVVAGLRTATGVWATVAIGMACGMGLYAVAAIATGLIILVQLVFYYGTLDGQDWMIRKIKVTVTDTPAARALLQQRVLGDDVRVLTARYKRQGDALQFTLRVRTARRLSIEQALRLCDEHEEILAISI